MKIKLNQNKATQFKKLMSKITKKHKKISFFIDGDSFLIETPLIIFQFKECIDKNNSKIYTISDEYIHFKKLIEFIKISTIKETNLIEIIEFDKNKVIFKFNDNEIELLTIESNEIETRYWEAHYEEPGLQFRPQIEFLKKNKQIQTLLKTYNKKTVKETYKTTFVKINEENIMSIMTDKNLLRGNILSYKKDSKFDFEKITIDNILLYEFYNFIIVSDTFLFKVVKNDDINFISAETSFGTIIVPDCISDDEVYNDNFPSLPIKDHLLTIDVDRTKFGSFFTKEMEKTKIDFVNKEIKTNERSIKFTNSLRKIYINADIYENLISSEVISRMIGDSCKVFNNKFIYINFFSGGQTNGKKFGFVILSTEKITNFKWGRFGDFVIAPSYNEFKEEEPKTKDFKEEIDEDSEIEENTFEDSEIEEEITEEIEFDKELDDIIKE